jgi:uncharacterized protein (TIGR02145 family)
MNKKTILTVITLTMMMSVTGVKAQVTAAVTGNDTAYVDCVTFPKMKPACDNGVSPPVVRFMKYNLGADPKYDTPKKQMKYLATHDFNRRDTHVYGKMYQWGRKRKQSDTSTWGNGVAADTETAAGGVLYNGKYYQRPVKTANDPCPKGFRIPTQDEWERIAAYDCDPSFSGGYFFFPTSAYSFSSPVNNGLTWVRVKNGKAYADDWSTGDRSGYAVYETHVWEQSKEKGGYFDASNSGKPDMKKILYADAAPEPLIFLPTAGYRNPDNGNILDTGRSGCYWSSTIHRADAYSLDFDGSLVDPNDYYNMINGKSVRCVADLLTD